MLVVVFVVKIRFDSIISPYLQWITTAVSSTTDDDDDTITDAASVRVVVVVNEGDGDVNDDECIINGSGWIYR